MRVNALLTVLNWYIETWGAFEEVHIVTWTSRSSSKYFPR